MLKRIIDDWRYFQREEPMVNVIFGGWLMFCAVPWVLVFLRWAFP
jgi:hypothetical protein